MAATSDDEVGRRRGCRAGVTRGGGGGLTEGLLPRGGGERTRDDPGRESDAAEGERMENDEAGRESDEARRDELGRFAIPSDADSGRQPAAAAAAANLSTEVAVSGDDALRAPPSRLACAASARRISASASASCSSTSCLAWKPSADAGRNRSSGVGDTPLTGRRWGELFSSAAAALRRCRVGGDAERMRAGSAACERASGDGEGLETNVAAEAEVEVAVATGWPEAGRVEATLEVGRLLALAVIIAAVAATSVSWCDRRCAGDAVCGRATTCRCRCDGEPSPARGVCAVDGRSCFGAVCGDGCELGAPRLDGVSGVRADGEE